VSEEGIREAARLLIEARYAVSLTGAGVSTPSGIPDFRSPGSGLWEKTDPMRVASIWAFRANPQAFYDWIFPLAEKLLIATPNPAHRALADLERLGKMNAVITQNIDSLHQKAGSQRVLELHGHTRDACCMDCGHVVALTDHLTHALARQQMPRCKKCAGILKPAAILFGELLPREILRGAQHEARKCDIMLVTGSSLEVTPASDLPWIAHQVGAQIIIVNYEPTPCDDLAAVVIRDNAASALPAIVAEIRAGDNTQ